MHGAGATRGSGSLWPPVCSNCSMNAPARHLLGFCFLLAAGTHCWVFLPSLPLVQGEWRTPCFPSSFSTLARPTCREGHLCVSSSPAPEPRPAAALHLRSSRQGGLCRRTREAGASVNEPHSSPAAGIRHVIVPGHRGRSEAPVGTLCPSADCPPH